MNIVDEVCTSQDGRSILITTSNGDGFRFATKLAFEIATNDNMRRDTINKFRRECPRSEEFYDAVIGALVDYVTLRPAKGKAS